MAGTQTRKKPLVASFGRRVKHCLTWGGTAALSWGVRHMPARCLPALSDRLTRLLWPFVQKRVARATQSIKLALPGFKDSPLLTGIVFRSTRNIVRTMFELFHLPAARKGELQSRVSVDGWEHLESALAPGRGAILLTAHFGNWELMGARIAAEGYRIVAVARDAEHPATAQIINSARNSGGVEVVGRDDVRRMIRALNDNALVAILPDQHIKGPAVVVDFMGRPARTAAGPASIHARTGCAILPAFCRYTDDGLMHVEIWKPLELVNTGNREADVLTNTQIVNDTIAKAIRKYPDQWLWLHNRWKSVEEPNEAQ